MNRRDALYRLSAAVGGAFSAPLLSGLLAGCRAGPAGETYAFQALTEGRDDLVAALADLIIPETDTPGARAARVDEFLDRMLTEWFEARDRDHFLDGLAYIDEAAQAEHGAAFAALGEREQLALATRLDAEAYALDDEPERESKGGGPEGASIAGTDDMQRHEQAETVQERTRRRQRFFREFKAMALAGYYTSEIGQTQELRPMPMGAWRPDVPYSEIGRAYV